MENLVEKINLILKTKNISARQFAEEIGVQPSGMSHILSGRNNPSLDFVMKVVRRYPEIDIKWLMFGQGEMLVKAAPSTSSVADSPAVVAKAPAKKAMTKNASSAELNLFSQLNENRVNEVAQPSVQEYSNLESVQPIPAAANNSMPTIDPAIMAAATMASVSTTQSKSKHIVRLLAFYDDHTFAEFLPE